MHRLISLDHPDESLEAHLTRHSRRSEAIYCATLTLVIAAGVALPVVRVPISVRANGMIRPTVETHEIRAPVSGFAERLHLEEHRRVSRGEELVRLRSRSMDARRLLLDTRIDEAGQALGDLDRLLESGGALEPDDLETTVYREEVFRYRRGIDEANRQVASARREFDRLAALAAHELVAQMELDDSETRLLDAVENRDAVELAFRAEWLEAARGDRTRLEDLREQRERLREDSSLLVIRAPIAGTVEQATSFSPDSYVQAGDPLLSISPAAPLIAEVYVEARDIGLLRPGADARLLLDSFNHNDWGALTGRITSIAEDYTALDDRPMFRVALEIGGSELMLPSGIRATLRKGMTLQARFDVATRSLWQLLRDDLDDWLNPAQQRG